MNKIKILYVGIKYSYAKKALGYSYEYLHFLDTLREMKDVEVSVFDWVTLSNKFGKEKMNKLLIVNADKFKPDMIFFTLFKDEFIKDTIKKLSEKYLTFNWFNDDISRFDSYIKNWAPLFSWVSTITPTMVSKYKKIGQKNVIAIQFGVNPRLFRELDLTKDIEVSFVGQNHSNRRRMLREISIMGITVEVWGKGWKSGVVGFKKMIEIINRSKINLNFTAFSFSYPPGRFIPWFLQPKRLTKRGINGRIFEVPACGSFLLTETFPNINNYYKLGKEIVAFDGIDDLIEKIKYFTIHDSEREKIAKAGYKRAIKDHTYEKRFREIFKKIGL